MLNRRILDVWTSDRLDLLDQQSEAQGTGDDDRRGE
jgi:hypothetical protein